ncbi:hypothetical protein [Paenibacillus sp. RC67]|uniref:hypothetical protein n=1 Tax=Paenibacillus sp. RC67 TaxID=3039392 RepID=UPI0024ACA7BD|nr:hypothetical protein [Paenibacillus sp. RC67]
MISYQNGAVNVKAPLNLVTTGKVMGMSKDETGFYISKDKMAIVYGFAKGASKPMHVLIADKKGKKWNGHEIKGAKGFETKFIGFTTKKEGGLLVALPTGEEAH